MNPKIKGLHSPDLPSFEDYRPEDAGDFYFLLQVMVGPETGPGEESFDVVVCSPKSFAKKIGSQVEMGRHYLFMNEYNRENLVSFIKSYVEHCSGNDWNEVATQLGRFGKWEFEDYRETGGKKSADS